MRTLRLFGIGIDSVRDIFGADEQLATHLREVVVRAFAPANPKSPGLLGKLGPLFKRAPATEVNAAMPLPADADALLAGGYIPPDRLVQSWELMLVWLDELSTHSVDISFHDFDAVEFDLARLGLSSEFALRSLAERELGIPLRPLPGQVTGYCRNLHATETFTALTRVLSGSHDDPDLQTETSAVVRPLMSLLETLSSDDSLDLVTVSTEGLTSRH